MRLATALRFDPEGHIVNLMMEKVDLIDAHHLRQIGFATFAYSALALTEGIGLMKGKAWAEYLTLSLTSFSCRGSFMSWPGTQPGFASGCWLRTCWCLRTCCGC